MCGDLTVVDSVRLEEGGVGEDFHADHKMSRGLYLLLEAGGRCRSSERYTYISAESRKRACELERGEGKSYRCKAECRIQLGARMLG